MYLHPQGDRTKHYYESIWEDLLSVQPMSLSVVTQGVLAKYLIASTINCRGHQRLLFLSTGNFNNSLEQFGTRFT